jgi:hypothetical protein
VEEAKGEVAVEDVVACWCSVGAWPWRVAAEVVGKSGSEGEELRVDDKDEE